MRRKILVPRSAQQAPPFFVALEEIGFEPLSVPLLEIRFLLQSELEWTSWWAGRDMDWLIFTSQNGVEAFFRHLPSTFQLPTSFHFAAVGRKTAQALEKWGVSVSFQPSRFDADAFVEQWEEQQPSGSRVMCILGNRARAVIPASLQRIGYDVTVEHLYETHISRQGQNELVEVVDSLYGVAFTSPSTVQAFTEIIKSPPSHLVFGAIGPITERALRNKGLPVHVLPEEFTVEALARSFFTYASQHT